MTAELFAALAKAQGEFEQIVKGKEVEVNTRTGGKYRFSYAPLEEIIATCRPVLAKHGLGFYHNVEPSENGSQVNCVLFHSSGQTVVGCSMAIPSQESIQEFGSALTYARRYTLQCALGVSAEDDDDGNHSCGGNTKTVNEKKNGSAKPPKQAETAKDAIYAAAERGMAKAITESNTPEVFRIFGKAQEGVAKGDYLPKFLDDLKAHFDSAILMRVRSAGTAEECIGLTELAREVMEAKLLPKDRYQVITQANMDRVGQLQKVTSPE